MDFKEINNLIPKEGERYIIIENGMPTKVVLCFEDYKKIASNPGKPIDQPSLDLPAVSEESEPEPQVNEIEQVKETVEEEKKEGTSEKPDKELTLEDLPF